MPVGVAVGAGDRSLLSGQVTLPSTPQQAIGEEAWIEVIRRMDEIHADLVRSQVELEEKNAVLEEAQRFIDSVLSAMSDVLIVADVNGRIQRVNQSLLNLTGRSETQLVGSLLTDLFSPESAEQVREFPERIRRGAIADCEVFIPNAQGVSVPISISCNPRYDSDGSLSGIVLTGHELGELRRAYRDLRKAHEELKRTQQQLLQSEKMASLGRLVAGVAHELNNPISFVFGNMHALKRYEGRLRQYLDAVHRGVGPEELHALREKLKIDRIRKDMAPLIDGSLEGAGRVSDIVQNLRRFATPQRPNRHRFDLVRVVDSAASWVAKAARHAPELRFDMPSELTVCGTEGYVHQILINLVQNSLDAMEGQGEPVLEIRVWQEGDQAMISVRDHGPGIAEHDLIRIFDPFFTTKPVGKGTGLGLYISYGLAKDQCAGDLTVRNHPEGGAEFTLIIPVEASDGDG